MNAPSPRRTLWLFAAAVAYIAAQTIWWALLLVRKDGEIDRLKEAVGRHNAEGTAVPDPSRRMLMVVGEAGVFLMLLTGLLYLVYRSVRRDLRQAGSQHNFLLAVTHELRTPIAAIKLQLSTLARPELNTEQRDQLRRSAAEEADRLALLTDKVLLATTAEENSVPLRLEEVDVLMLLRGSIDRALARGVGSHCIELRGQQQFVTRSDPHALRSIAENLIENAMKYSPSGSKVEVEVRTTTNGWQLVVSDEGPGVALGERERIFERFHRSGSEEVRAAQGTGLGLFIVRRLAHRMGGHVEVRGRAPHGSIFIATFPQR